MHSTSRKWSLKNSRIWRAKRSHSSLQFHGWKPGPACHFVCHRLFFPVIKCLLFQPSNPLIFPLLRTTCSEAKTVIITLIKCCLALPISFCSQRHLPLIALITLSIADSQLSHRVASTFDVKQMLLSPGILEPRDQIMEDFLLIWNLIYY